MLPLLYLLVYLFAGCVIIRALLPAPRPRVRVWLGLSLGLLLLMWLPALLAFAVRFSLLGHMLALILLAGITVAVWVTRDKTPARALDDKDRQLLILMACVAVPLTLLGGYLQYTHCLREVNGTLHVGQSTYGDLPLHLGIITSLRGAAVPPEYSILPGERLSYPFLMDSLSTSFMIFGLPLRWAVIIPGTLMMGLVFSGYMILADRMASGRRAVVIAALFVFINGGLGFLYSLDTLGVSNGGSVNSLQSGTWLERLNIILRGWYQTPANHAEQSYYNLRWSNIIVDMLVPQRTFLGGWCMLLPCIYLLYDAAARKEQRFPLRQMVLLGVMAGGLPLLHTHSFLALGLLSAGWMVYDLCHRGKLWPWLLYGGLACILAAPQLFGFTFRHTNGNSSFVYFQFNWVNNSGGNGLRDGYLFFYIKNIGIPVILLILSLFEKNPRRRFIAAGAFTIFAVAELIIFQPNEYDNNKLFYVWWALCAVLAAEYAVEIFDRLRGLRGRYVLAVMTAIACLATGTLSIARECVSDYQMYAASDVEAAQYVEENTDRDSTFICWTQHINPVSALAGRRIVCGPGLWLTFHGYDLAERETDISAFYTDPAGNESVLQKYDVDYILLGDYERYELHASQATLDALYPLVFESSDGRIRIYQVTESHG